MADSTSGRCTCACLCQSEGLEDLSMSSSLLARKRLVHFPLLASWWGSRDKERNKEPTRKNKKRAKQKPAFEVTMAKGPAPAEVRWLGMCVCVGVSACLHVCVCECEAAEPSEVDAARIDACVCVCVSDYCACPGGGRCALERVHERLDPRGVLRG